MTPSPLGSFQALALPILMSQVGVGSVGVGSEAIAVTEKINKILLQQSELGSRQFLSQQSMDPYDYMSPRLVPQRVIRLKIQRVPRIQPKPHEFEGQE